MALKFQCNLSFCLVDKIKSKFFLYQKQIVISNSRLHDKARNSKSRIESRLAFVNATKRLSLRLQSINPFLQSPQVVGAQNLF